MANVEIDRLTLKLSGFTHSDGERLAQLVANGLAAASQSESGSDNVPRISVAVQSDSGSNLNQVSNQIVREILRQLSA